MEPTLHKVRVNGAELAYFERGTRRDDLPTLFFVHATGFHGRVWDYHAEAFPEHHIICLEQRGHGRSEKLAVTNWRTFGEDQAAVVEALDLSGLIGIGHSMGAHGMIDGAALSGRFGRLVLLDPTVAEESAYGPEYFEMFGDELHPAAKRRNLFTSVEEMIEVLSPKSSFPLFHPRILKDYCQYGLEPTESGEFVLACRPEVEAHVYMAARSNGAVYASARTLDIPVTVVRAKLPAPDAGHDFSSSPTWPGLAGEFKQGVDIHWPDCTHFIPMQRPDDVIGIVRQQVELEVEQR
jgi:pimeloyl-ACP methyl ester carboxylesterase